ncbi:hypothetical protein RFI_28262 [Reticulomyxa filosa]|uniref:Uncharacterized protein n=1 Tax=Reticulomyxa filosa TaxID=46433 RepID=X6M5D1_RETFI|nr:hypothetical protein RFI_28262 [Reticulomyxa filosa]|eukprot:ETO09124.1 hypothetical protein RFI_28262 [Reticulomyxa filosa]
MKSRDLPRVPKAALQFVEQKKKDWLQSLPPGLKQYANDTIIQKKSKKAVFAKWRALPGEASNAIVDIFSAVPRTQFGAKAKAQGIEDSSRNGGNARPDLRIPRRDASAPARKGEKEKYEASTKKVTDMKFLADAFDELDDAWMDGNRDYYSIAYPTGTFIYFYFVYVYLFLFYF